MVWDGFKTQGNNSHHHGCNLDHHHNNIHHFPIILSMETKIKPNIPISTVKPLMKMPISMSFPFFLWNYSRQLNHDYIKLIHPKINLYGPTCKWFNGYIVRDYTRSRAKRHRMTLRSDQWMGQTLKFLQIVPACIDIRHGHTRNMP